MASESRFAQLAAQLDSLNEYERAPITPDKFQRPRYFAAMFGGEHVAGTEFVIGSLFVLWGVTARDLILGLIVGNLMAVLSWTFICAPIGTRIRLTLYWYLRRIAGPGLGVLYNIANAVLYCFLAGAMIALCADAACTGLEKLGLQFQHPTLNDLYPNSAGWVVMVLLCGGVVTTLAILGFEKMAKFASNCVPWVFLIFIAGAIVTLPKLGMEGIGDFWRIASERVWTGEPIPGQPHANFWHVASFAWFCNLAMHVDLSDMAIFRYARHWSYGLFSALGMFLGHFLAWICSGIMCAPFRDAIIRDQGLPVGSMAFGAAGLAGLICVLFASWTTANPTMYRAGLALQIATPRWQRWKVTLVAGIVTSIAACFPFFIMKLLGFVAIYGLVLMPIGAIVFAEHWLFPRFGLTQYWAERRGLFVNPAALITWVGVLLFCFLVLQWWWGVDLFFLWYPGYVLAITGYILLAAILGGRAPAGEPSEETAAEAPSPAVEVPPPRKPESLPPYRQAARLIAGLSLVAIVGLAVAVFLGKLDEDSFKIWIGWSTLAWFASAPLWLTPGLFGLKEK